MFCAFFCVFFMRNRPSLNRPFIGLFNFIQTKQPGSFFLLHDVIHDDRSLQQMVPNGVYSPLLLSRRSLPEGVSAGLLVLHGGDGGEAEPAEPLRHESPRLQA